MGVFQMEWKNERAVQDFCEGRFMMALRWLGKPMMKVAKYQIMGN